MPADDDDGSDAAPAPLIVTAWLDLASFERFDAMRRTHFPPEFNIVPAHLTVFHKLPGAAQTEIQNVMDRHCRVRAPIALAVTGVQLLGRGVAYQINAPELAALHDLLAQRWSGWLTLQDQQAYRPHVVIQNKVPFETARDLCEELSDGFKPFTATANGLRLWFYRNGPWERAHDSPFGPDVIP